MGLGTPRGRLKTILGRLMAHSDGGHGSVALLLADRERELCEDIGHK